MQMRSDFSVGITRNTSTVQNILVCVLEDVAPAAYAIWSRQWRSKILQHMRQEHAGAIAIRQMLGYSKSVVKEFILEGIKYRLGIVSIASMDDAEAILREHVYPKNIYSTDDDDERETDYGLINIAPDVVDWLVDAVRREELPQELKSRIVESYVEYEQQVNDTDIQALIDNL